MKNKNTAYISGKESKRLSAASLKLSRKLEKRRKSAGASPEQYETKMRLEANIVEFDGLCTCFFTDTGVVKAVDGVCFDIPKGATVGVVGESGCGKSVTSLSLMQLLQRPQGQVVGGEIRFNLGDGRAYDLARAPAEIMQALRGSRMAMIFQEPMTSLNPVFRIGKQLDEVLQMHTEGFFQPGGEEKPKSRAAKAVIKRHSVEMLALVGIADPEGVYQMYPHQLSGGMRQRVMIAMALSCNPALIIADEPTTALDVTIQAQILDLLKNLKSRLGSSVMLITHDLGVVADMSDYVVVMYAGRVVEKGASREIFHDPRHPYTLGLMKSKPVAGRKADKLYNIPGAVPNPVNMPDYCYFRDRCEFAHDRCRGAYPPEIRLSDTHTVSCYRYMDQGEILSYPRSVDLDGL